jgi:hypothetical protein
MLNGRAYVDFEERRGTGRAIPKSKSDVKVEIEIEER